MSIDQSSGRVIGIDLGGTNLRGSVASPVRGNSDHCPEILEPPSSVSGLQRSVAELARRVEAEGTHVRAIGIGIPGLVEGTRCAWVPNLAFLDGVDLAALWDIPVVAGNDAQFALLAEVTCGAAAGRKAALLLAIGTGIGSALMVDSHIVRGVHGGACSFGWACGDIADGGDDRHGWLERHASGAALDVAAHAIGAAGGAALVERARRGDRQAVDALSSAATALGVTLAGALSLLDPGLVVVAGGVAASWDALEPLVRSSLLRQLPPHLRDIEIVVGAHGAAAGLIGAIEAARRGHEWWIVGG